jgi:hypothetical protein
VRDIYIECFLMMSNKFLKHVEAVNRNKLKENSASCWYFCADIL